MAWNFCQSCFKDLWYPRRSGVIPSNNWQLYSVWTFGVCYWRSWTTAFWRSWWRFQKWTTFMVCCALRVPFTQSIWFLLPFVSTPLHFGIPPYLILPIIPLVSVLLYKSWVHIKYVLIVYALFVLLAVSVIYCEISIWISCGHWRRSWRVMAKDCRGFNHLKS